MPSTMSSGYVREWPTDRRASELQGDAGNACCIQERRQRPALALRSGCSRPPPAIPRSWQNVLARSDDQTSVHLEGELPRLDRRWACERRSTLQDWRQAAEKARSSICALHIRYLSGRFVRAWRRDLLRRVDRGPRLRDRAGERRFFQRFNDFSEPPEARESQHDQVMELAPKDQSLRPSHALPAASPQRRESASIDGWRRIVGIHPYGCRSDDGVTREPNQPSALFRVSITEHSHSANARTADSSARQVPRARRRRGSRHARFCPLSTCEGQPSRSPIQNGLRGLYAGRNAAPTASILRQGRRSRRCAKQSRTQLFRSSFVVVVEFIT